MARFSNPFVQYFNGSGQVLPGNKLFFFETGTTTPKDTYSDSGLTTSNANPVVADADGRIPDIFLDGIYKVQLKDTDDVVIDTADPVGDTSGGQFSDWLNDNIYVIPNIVKGSDGEYYRSIANSNQGNDPISSPAQWEELELGRIWNPNVTYSATDSVYGSDGNLYKSKAASNLNNDPISTNAWDAGTKVLNSGASGHLFGLTTSNGTDTDHDIDVAIGTCTDSTNATVINSLTAITKQIDANWAEGSAAGGFPSGLTLTADTTYHVFVIAKPDGTVDAGFDSDLSATNLLTDASDYTLFRRIASIYTDGSSNIVQYLQDGDKFFLDLPILDQTIANPGGTGSGVTFALSIPTGLEIYGMCVLYLIDTTPTANTQVYFSSPLLTDQAASASLFDLEVGPARGAAQCNKDIITNTSAEIRYRMSASNADHVLREITLGWIDDRGKL